MTLCQLLGLSSDSFDGSEESCEGARRRERCQASDEGRTSPLCAHEALAAGHPGCAPGQASSLASGLSIPHRGEPLCASAASLRSGDKCILCRAAETDFAYQRTTTLPSRCGVKY
jgi:hypothetical protein